MGFFDFLGGLLNKPPSAYKQTRQGILGQAAGAREAAAQYGFNPLTLLGVSSPIGAGSGPMMGSSISDAFSLLADSLANRPGVGEKEALTRENADLRDQLRKQTLQPEVPGIYPRMQQGVGGGNGISVGGTAGAGVSGAGVGAGSRGAGGVRPLPTVSPLDERREVNHEPVRTHPGVIQIDNPNLPFPITIPTLDGDEAASLLDLASGGVYAGLSAFRHYAPQIDTDDWVARFAPRIGGVAPSGFYPPRPSRREQPPPEAPYRRARRARAAPSFGFTPNSMFGF